MSKNVQDLLTATAYDNNGDKIGDVNEVFVDDASGQPSFVDVNHGLFGMGNSLVPLRGHSIDGTNLTLGFSKDRIKGAPNFDADKPLTPEQQTEIYDHYGISAAAHTDGYTGGERTDGQTPGADSAQRDVTDAGNRSAGAEHAGTNQDGTGTSGAGAAGVAGAGVAGAGVAGAGAAATNNKDDRPHPDFSDNVNAHEDSAARHSFDERGSETGADIPGNTASETAAVGSTDPVTPNNTASTQDTDIPGNSAAETAAVGSADAVQNSGAETANNAGSAGTPAGETRLRKYIVTDTETVEVPVQREEIRVERVPSSEDGSVQPETDGDANFNQN